MSFARMAEGSGNVRTDAVSWVFPAFLIVVFIALVIRVVIAVARRKPRGIRDAFEPIVRTGRIPSELYGVKTYDGEDLAPKTDNSPRDPS